MPDRVNRAFWVVRLSREPCGEIGAPLCVINRAAQRAAVHQFIQQKRMLRHVTQRPIARGCEINHAVKHLWPLHHER